MRLAVATRSSSAACRFSGNPSSVLAGAGSAAGRSARPEENCTASTSLPKSGGNRNGGEMRRMANGGSASV
eukprot:1675412-Prymnesium_polylepis.1